ncbi:MAG: hypothetical protein LIP05_00115 [Tannerellaceae bacterium]|nr:hypothetical protein [Tannerellaceae bacterium]
MNGNNSVITFKLSDKKKRGLLLTTIFSAIFGATIIWFSRSLPFGSGKLILSLIGIFMIIITCFCIYAYYLLAQEKFAAIYISDEGMIDKSTGNQIGTVLWKDVESIKVMDDISSNMKQKYLVLKVVNPNEYIDREPNRRKKRSLELRFQYYGSPICFSNRALNCTFDELKSAVFTKYEAYRMNHPSTS